jgi:N-acetylglucosamine kinase-like BadF-type ATPase
LARVGQATTRWPGWSRPWPRSDDPLRRLWLKLARLLLWTWVSLAWPGPTCLWILLSSPRPSRGWASPGGYASRTIPWSPCELASGAVGGVAVISGAGFNAGGIGRDGQEIQLPGLGELSGDWGGGVDIAQEVIRLICRAWDGRGQPTALTEMVLTALGLPSVEELIAQLYQSQFDYYPGQFDQRRLLALVPLVFEAAYGGDQVAQDLVVRVGAEVGTTANAIIRRLRLETTDVEVVLGGSVFKGKGPLLVDTVTQVVHRIAPQATIVLPEFEPVVGAVFLALESLGWGINETVYANVRASLPDELRPEQLVRRSSRPW